MHAEFLGRLQAIQDFAEAVLIDWSTLELDLVNWVPVIFLLPKQWVDLNAHLIKYEAFQ
jgi:hypothetical protein